MVSIFTIGSACMRRTPQFESVAGFDLSPKGRGMLVDRDVPLVHIVSSNANWVDCLTPKGSGEHLVVSERVIRSIESHKLTGAVWVPVELAFSKARNKVNVGLNYYMIFPEGDPPPLVQRIYEKIGEEFIFRFETLSQIEDPRCEVFNRKDGFIPHIKRVLMDNNWEGKDFMKVPYRKESTFPFGVFYCSRRVLEIAHQENWSNFSFNPVDSFVSATWNVDFRTRDWPPETWYPRYQV